MTYRNAGLPAAALLLVASMALSGCSEVSPRDGEGAGSRSSESPAALSPADFDVLLGAQRASVAVFAEQWENNDCNVALALMPENVVCSSILASADVTGSYEDLTGGLQKLGGDPSAADDVRKSFADSVAASFDWDESGCAARHDTDCTDEGERLIGTLLALNTAFKRWEG